MSRRFQFSSRTVEPKTDILNAMEKPPFQFDLKAFFWLMTVVAVFRGVHVYLPAPAKIVSSVCELFGVAFFLLWVLGWLKLHHLLFGLKMAAAVPLLLPGILFCMAGGVEGMLVALLLYLPFFSLVAIWVWCGLGNVSGQSGPPEPRPWPTARLAKNTGRRPPAENRSV
ncbi:MAG TPA: hypothetical protein VG125_02865 [Pirellulales bacterium]|jgi:hypothetical protein|nr:hypothetical protein [Pirellulales bacterium]